MSDHRKFFLLLLLLATFAIFSKPARAAGSVTSSSRGYCYSGATSVSCGSWMEALDVMTAYKTSILPAGWSMVGFHHGAACAFVNDTSCQYYWTVTHPTYGTNNNSNLQVFLTGVADSCPPNSTGTAPSCTCDVNYQPALDGITCEYSSISPDEQAGLDAYDRAIQDGFMPSAAEAAKQAATVAYASGLSDSAVAIVATTAARVVQAGGTLNDGLAAALAASTPSYYAGSIPAGSDPVAACNLFAAQANTVGTYDFTTKRCTLESGHVMQLSSVTPADLGLDSAPLVDSAPPPLSVSIAGAGAYQTATDLGLTTVSAQYAAQLAQQAIQDGKTPTQAAELSQAAIDAMIAWNSETVAAQVAAAQAAYNAKQNGATVEAQSAAAAAAVNVIKSGGSTSQAVAAGQTAVAGVASGLSGSAAVAAAGATGTSTGGATEATLKDFYKTITTPPSTDDVPLDGQLGHDEVAVAFSPISFVSSANCPAPIAYSMLGNSYELSFDYECDLLTMFRPLILTFASFTVALIYIRGFS